ncbi:hypothetical protein FKM82_003157 [Ascaphus truei]
MTSSFLWPNCRKQLRLSDNSTSGRKPRRVKRKHQQRVFPKLVSKPPHRGKFIDCYQKIKLAFNLLAKLRRHIQSPSSAELIHFLFGPLELIVQSTGGPELARTVISPLLSKDTTDFLRGHLTPKEMLLWEMLGDAWTKSRLEWPREPLVPQYIPKFHSGWSAPLDIFQGAPWELDLGHPPVSKPQEELSVPKENPYKSSSIKRSQSSEQSVSPKINRKYEAPVPGLPKRYAKILYDCTARSANELSVLKGEVLEVVEENKQWWKLRNRSGQEGYVPFNVLDVVSAEDLNSQPDGLYNMPRSPRGPVSPVHKLPSSYAGDKWASEMAGWTTNQNTKEQLINHMDEVNDELLKKITNKQGPQRNYKVERPQQVHVPLTFQSDAEEVKAWLDAKGFSKVTSTHLGILTGAQLFSLNKEELKKVCGEEGARVYSQMAVQKSVLEKSQGETELQEIMKRRQEKIETPK